MLLVEEFFSAAVQVAAALIIAFVVYLIFGRKTGRFKNYTGLGWPPLWAIGWGVAAGLVLALAGIVLFTALGLTGVATGEGTFSGKLKTIGPTPTAFAFILIIAFIKTSLSEEIFFRGIIAKRLIAWLGLVWGNPVQAAIFGAVHLLLFFVPGGLAFSWFLALILFLFTGAMGWVFAYLNERKGNGSIVPGWLAHGVLNAVSYPVFAFLA